MQGSSAPTPGPPAPFLPPAHTEARQVRPIAAPFLADLGALLARTDHLPPELRIAHQRFVLRLWRWGEVFSAEADLARAFGLRLRSFRRGRDALARLFTIDAAGGWHDLTVEAARAAALARQEGPDA